MRSDRVALSTLSLFSDRSVNQGRQLAIASLIITPAPEHVVRDLLAVDFDPGWQPPCKVGVGALELPLVEPVLPVLQLLLGTVLDGLLNLLQPDLFGNFPLLTLGPPVPGVGEWFSEVVDPGDTCHPVLLSDLCLVPLGDIELLHLFAGDDSLEGLLQIADVKQSRPGHYQSYYLISISQAPRARMRTSLLRSTKSNVGPKTYN